MTAKQDQKSETPDGQVARERLAATGRNDPCPCGSGKKYKKCHLAQDEAATAAPAAAPDPEEMLASGWRLFERRRPGAAEKVFRSALTLRPDWADALAGIGLARLQAGDNEGARREFREVQRVSEAVAVELRASGAKDAFARKESQALVRSCHALGCLAFDEKEYEEALVQLERVFAIDEGAVGTEARLIAGVALVKLGRAAEAVPVLEVATKSEAGAGRASMSLALAHLLCGNRAAAEQALGQALAANAHLAKALLGRMTKRAANLGAAPPGSREEALGYVQTYGDAWEAEAKRFLEDYLQAQAALHKAAEVGQDASQGS
ncbi:MAG: SEC-C domain-containing protein [Deltaproteobacteria bacterium]|nr:SEC-C domain-containing protein [Deltaproteobacteria bacterium]